MATTDERLTKVEDTTTKLVEFQGLLLGHQDHVVQLLVKVTEQVEEYRRDAKQMQRVWVHIARKYGWLDDDGSVSNPFA